MKMLAATAMVLALAACDQGPAGNSAANAGATPAARAAAPDLRGTWQGTGQSIVTGQAKHHAAPGATQPMLDNVPFTYVVEGQDGNRFWGTLSSPHFKEVVTGVVGHDGKSITARTSEGEIRGTIADTDTIDIVYSGGGESTVVAINTWKRQK